MEEGLALAGSVVIYPCNIDFLLSSRLSIRTRLRLSRIYPLSVPYFVSSVYFTRVTVYHMSLEIEVLYPWSLLAVWVSHGWEDVLVTCSVPLMCCSRRQRSRISLSSLV